MSEKEMSFAQYAESTGRTERQLAESMGKKLKENRTATKGRLQQQEQERREKQLKSAGEYITDTQVPLDLKREVYTYLRVKEVLENSFGKDKALWNAAKQALDALQKKG